MVWPFKKKKIVDLTKKNIKIPKNIRKRLEESVEYKDLTSKDSKEDSSGLGFLGNLASSSVEREPGNLKRKFEDFEFKLESMGRRIDKILDRLDLAEKKLERDGY